MHALSLSLSKVHGRELRLLIWPLCVCLAQPVTSGKSQTDAFWDVWAEHPNYIAFSLVVITLIESKRSHLLL